MKKNLHIEYENDCFIHISNAEYSIWGKSKNIDNWTSWDHLFFGVVDLVLPNQFAGTLVTIGDHHASLHEEFPPFKVRSQRIRSIWSRKLKVYLSTPDAMDNRFWELFTTSVEYRLNNLLICDLNIKAEEYLIDSAIRISNWYHRSRRNSDCPPPAFSLGNWVWPRISGNSGELMLFLQPSKFASVKKFLLNSDVTKDYEVNVVKR